MNTAWGQEVVCSLVVLQLILLYLLPGSSRVHKLWLVWVFFFFFSILSALRGHLTSPMSLILTLDWYPMKSWAVFLITSCRAFLSSSEHIPCQIVMPSLDVDFMVLLYLIVPIFSNVYLLISVCIARTELSDEAILKTMLLLALGNCFSLLPDIYWHNNKLILIRTFNQLWN